MTTDYWSTEEGAVDDHYVIGFFTASSTCTEGAAMKIGTGVVGAIKCQNATAIGDGWGVALRAAATNAMVPVLVQGICKMTTDGSGTAVTSGNWMMNSGIYVKKPTLGADTDMWGHGGSSHVFGMALQPSTLDGDEILLLVGKTG